MARDYFPLVVYGMGVTTVDVARSFGAGQSFLVGATADSTLQSFGGTPLSIGTRWAHGATQEFVFSEPDLGQSVTLVNTTPIAGPTVNTVVNAVLNVAVPARTTALVQVYGVFSGTVSSFIGATPTAVISINQNTTVTSVTTPDMLVLSNLSNAVVTYTLKVTSLSSGSVKLYAYQITGGTVYRFERDDVTLQQSWNSYRTMPQRMLDGIGGISAFDPDGIYNHFAMMAGAYQTEVLADARVIRNVRDPYKVPAEYIDAAGAQIGRTIPGQLPDSIRRGILSTGPLASRARGSATAAAIEMRGIGYQAAALERWIGSANPILCFDALGLPSQITVTNPANPSEILHTFFNPGYDTMTTNAPTRIHVSGFYGYDAFHAAQGAIWVDPAYAGVEGDTITLSDSTGSNPTLTVTFSGSTLVIGTTALTLPVTAGYTASNFFVQIAEFLTGVSAFSSKYYSIAKNVRHDDLYYTNPTASVSMAASSIAPVTPVYASGSITFTGLPASGSSITISDGNTRLGGVTFQFGGTPSDSVVPVTIGGSTTACAANLHSALTTFVAGNPGRLKINATNTVAGVVSLSANTAGTHSNVALTSSGTVNATLVGLSGGSGETSIVINCPDGANGYVYVPANDWSAGGVSMYQINPDGSDGLQIVLTPTLRVTATLGSSYYTTTPGWATVAGYWLFTSQTGAIRVYNNATGTTPATVVAVAAAAVDQYRTHGTYLNTLSRFWPVSATGVYYSKVDGTPITYPPSVTTATVTVGGQTWAQVADFTTANADSWYYTLSTDSSGKYVVTFGDGSAGFAPVGTVSVTYYNSGGALTTDLFTATGSTSYSVTTSATPLPVGGALAFANADRTKATAVLSQDAFPATARVAQWGTLYNTETATIGLSDDLLIEQGTLYGILRLKSGGRYLLKSGAGFIRLHV